MALATLLLVGPASAAPNLTVPGDIVAEAESAAGASVTYTASASNPQDKPLPLSCDGPGGSSGVGTLTVTAVFPLGSTVVTCVVEDEVGKSGAAIRSPSPSRTPRHRP